MNKQNLLLHFSFLHSQVFSSSVNDAKRSPSSDSNQVLSSESLQSKTMLVQYQIIRNKKESMISITVKLIMDEIKRFWWLIESIIIRQVTFDVNHQRVVVTNRSGAVLHLYCTVCLQKAEFWRNALNPSVEKSLEKPTICY